MRLTVVSYALIGLGHSYEVWDKKLRPVASFTNLPGCEHKHSNKFCPECGRPEIETVQTNTKEVNSFCLSDELEEIAKRIGMQVGTNGGEEFICIGVGPKKIWRDDSYKPLECFQLSGDVLAAVHDSLKAKFEPLGLWSEAAFGLWNVLYTG